MVRSPHSLPRANVTLRFGACAGITYDWSSPIKNITDPLYWNLIQAGATIVQIGMDWASIEADNATGLNNVRSACCFLVFALKLC